MVSHSKKTCLCQSTEKIPLTWTPPLNPLTTRPKDPLPSSQSLPSGRLISLQPRRIVKHCMQYAQRFENSSTKISRSTLVHCTGHLMFIWSCSLRKLRDKYASAGPCEASRRNPTAVSKSCSDDQLIGVTRQLHPSDFRTGGLDDLQSGVANCRQGLCTEPEWLT